MTESAMFDPGTWPFTLALGGVFLIAALEALSALAGAPLSGLLDEALPDMDVDVDLDADLDIDGAFGGSFAETALSWLSFGRVPVLVLLVLFLLGFGITGVAAQAVAQAALGTTVMPLLVAIPAVAAGIFSMKVFGAAIARIVPKEETAAISRRSFVGRTGVVAGGTARAGMPAQVRITDEHGTTHYLLAEPDEASEAYPTGTRVLVVSIEGSKARVIRDPHAGLAK